MLVYWIWLSILKDVKDSEKRILLQRFSDPEDIYYARRKELEAVEDIHRETIDAICRKDLAEAEKILACCREKDIRVLTMAMDTYPARLKNIADPPLVLYCRGELPDFEGEPCIGVVGTRKASAYGLNTAKRMGWQISRCGGTVVSGMAGGIDSAATEGGLAAGKSVVGVLGTGVDVVFPKSNRWLFERMEREGCLISEYPPGTPAYKWNFPRRNRIISGLCCGVLVVEAPVHSGALITARQALEQGRDVFVVPGNIDVASCEGSNALLRDGAIMASSGWDVVSEYEAAYPGRVKKDLTPMHREARPLQVAQPVKAPLQTAPSDKKDIDNPPQSPYSDRDSIALSARERTVLAAIPAGGGCIDDIIAETGLDAGAVLASLTTLQICGHVTLLPGRRVAVN